MTSFLILNRHQKRHWQSFAMAIGVESLLALLMVGWAYQHLPTTPTEVIPLSIEMLMDKPPEKLAMPKASPRVQSPSETKIKPSSRQESSPPVEQPAVTNETLEAHLPVFKDASPTSVPAHTTQVLNPTIDPTQAYNVKLAAAVQAAFEVPGSAKALGFKGKARVEFNLRDGLASVIRVIQSSGLGAVDRAALRAVEVAKLPAPPTVLKSKEGTYQIWVECY